MLLKRNAVLNYKEMSVLRTALSTMFNGREDVRIYDDCAFAGEKITFVVNWAAIGSVSPKEAIEFAKKISETAGLCKKLNALDMTLGEGYPALTREEYEKMLKEFVEELDVIMNVWDY